MPGFWVRLAEEDARAVARGELPAQVREDIVTTLNDYDAHMAKCQQELERQRKKKEA